VQRQVVADEGLAAVFVDALEDFVARCVAEAGEERGEFGGGRGGGEVAKDDAVEGGEVGDLLAWLIYYYLGMERARTLDELDMSRLAMVSTGWNTISSAIPAEPEHGQYIVSHIWGTRIPDPSNRAMPDSLLYSLPAAPMAGAIAGGDIWSCVYVRGKRKANEDDEEGR
jgi:hypothetical protein